MLFFTPRHRKEAKITIRGVRKLIRYRRDVLPPTLLRGLEDGIGELKAALGRGDRETIERATAELRKTYDRAAPPPKWAGVRENTEVLVVAFVIALAIRAFFLQPFKIPTGSMHPTLDGVMGYVTEAPPPALPQKVAEFLLRGRTYIDVPATADDVITGLREVSRFHFFISTEVMGRLATYSIPAPLDVVKRDFGLHPGKPLAKGQPVVRGYVDAGDQLFVDKVSYNFVPPQRGDVFVFKTTGIRRIEINLDPRMGSQYYIKRLAGLPGDVLRIDPPQLFINGHVAREAPFVRVMTNPAYRGYSNRSMSPQGPAFPLLGSPQDTFEVPPHSYFALGDNSYNSSDSRFWGPVPERNVVGRGFFVYWPILSHFGLID